MKKSQFLFIFLCISFFANAQTSISGFINFGNTEQAPSKISLYKIEEIHSERQDVGSLLSTSLIEPSGFFYFDNNLLDDKEQIYKVEVEWELGSPIDVIDYKYFILSKTDSIYFHKSDQLLGNYSNTNLADLEWQRLNEFNSNMPLQKGILQQNNYKNYLKDSLQILLVKLIGIKQLDDKKLLEKDISENREYYVNLLRELQATDLDTAKYAHLENKIMMLSLQEVEQKYQTSLIWNVIALVLIIGLLVGVFQLRKKLNTVQSIPVPNLSKQEATIKALILEGKSNKEIANELFISISTVKSHITNLYKKLGVTNRREIV